MEQVTNVQFEGFVKTASLGCTVVMSWHNLIFNLQDKSSTE